MSEDNEEKIAAAAAVVVAAPVGPWAQTVNGVKIAFATKKAAMAAYTLFFGLTAAAAGYGASGMTNAQLQERIEMQDTIVMMAEKQAQMETRIIDLQSVVVPLETSHGWLANDHVLPDHEHEHEHAAVIPVVIVGPKGDTGPAGPAGKDGVGKTGPAGPAGKDGVNVEAASVAPIAVVAPVVLKDDAPAVEVEPEHEHGFWCDRGKASEQPHRHGWNPADGCRSLPLN